MIEMIIATFIMVVGIVGVMSLLQRVIFSSSVSSSRLIAAYLAQEGAEIVRNVRDTNWLETSNWDEGLTNCSSGCIVDYNHSYDPGDLLAPDLPVFTGQFLRVDSNGFYSYNGPIETQTKFQRKITITPAADFLNVKVDIFWSEKGKSYTFSAQENLYNW